MDVENALIARICHDLITPCNAINLGLETYEMTEDKELLSCIKESAQKANAILKFMRELFSSKEDSFIYSEESIRGLVQGFLDIYHIECDFNFHMIHIPAELGGLVFYNVAIMKELMPFGGRMMLDATHSVITITYSGKNASALDTKTPQALTYQNILRFKLLKKLEFFGFKISCSENSEKYIILEKFE